MPNWAHTAIVRPIELFIDRANSDNVNISATGFGAGVPILNGSWPAIIGNFPPKNPNFTGRVELLEHLDRHLRVPGTTTTVLPHALHGMGGVGKTQLAIEYAYRHLADYQVIWWIPAETPALISASLVELAQRLELPGAPTANTAVPAVREALRNGEPYEHWLLIFDNAESPQTVSSFFPVSSQHGSILVTSRNPAWNSLGIPLEVDVFERAESIELLTRREPSIRSEDADRLAEALSDLPLAIEQVAAYIATTGIPAPEYLRLLGGRIELLEDEDQRPIGYPTSVAAAWDMSLEALRERDPAALRLLQVCAFLAPDISRSLLSSARGMQIDPALDEALRDPVKLGRAIRGVSRYSLAKIDHWHDVIQMHRLLQRVLVSRMTDDERDKMRHGAHLLIAASDPNQPDAPSQWPLYAQLYSHVLAADAIRCEDAWVRQLVANEAKYLWRWGEHKLARNISQNAYDEWKSESTDGAENPDALNIARWLGFMLFVNGDYQHAAEHNARTLEIHERLYGAEHEDTLAAIGAVAADRMAQGDFGEALALTETVHRRAVRTLGADDPLTLEAAHGLAVSLRLSGQFQRACEVDEVTWRQKVEIFGSDHLDSLLTLGGLNIDRRELGQYVEARAAQEDLVATYRRLLGDDRHHELLLAILHLSVARRKAGHHAEALAASSVSRQRFAERYGNEHPGSILAVLEESIDRRHNWDLRGARPLGEEARNRFRTVFGPDHPHTLAAAVNLATTLRLSGEVNAAREIDESALATLTARLGGDHPLILACAINLASDLYQLGDFQKAYDRDSATIADARRVLGAEHPTVLACASNLSLDLRALGRAPEANALLEVTMEAFKRVLREQHPAVRAAANRVRATCDLDPMPF
ncbi:FxSxx-COOH system tetratricopeptide repeat protein [Dactylosporangium sp. NPDC051541]|uniref:FxSxx-COOH system tetratricopeptide repeat protein n=1 Tax=Dactylosporangium sp. NPDC051541 TaxID=3363977 RepID=UPI00378C89B5